MSDHLSPEHRHACMSNNRSRNTRPELVMRRELWRLGFRYRINDKRLPGSPDVVLPKYRTVIFVHGCFWHGHKDCKLYSVPQTNTEFWVAKVSRNQERDQEVWRKLEAKGWSVIIVWECQLKKGNIDKTIGQVSDEILRNGEHYRLVQQERRQAKQAYLREQKARRQKEKDLLEEVLSMSPSGVSNH